MAKLSIRCPRSYQDVEAALGDRQYRRIGRETELCRARDGSAIYATFWHTRIVEYYQEGYRVYSGGYQTVTTRDRLNRLVPMHIYQRAYRWYVTYVPFQPGRRGALELEEGALYAWPRTSTTAQIGQASPILAILAAIFVAVIALTMHHAAHAILSSAVLLPAAPVALNMRRRARYATQRDQIVANVLDAYATSSSAQRAVAHVWHDAMRAHVLHTTAPYALSEAQSLALFALLSPRRSVPANMDLLAGVCEHGALAAPGLTWYQRCRAYWLLIADLDVRSAQDYVTGPKVGMFYRALCGDSRAVCVDRRVATVATRIRHTDQAIGRARHILIRDAISRAAASVAWTPRDMATLLWIVAPDYYAMPA